MLGLDFPKFFFPNLHKYMDYSYFEISQVIQKTQTTKVIYLDTFMVCEQLTSFAFLKTSSSLFLHHLADFP